MARPLLFLSWFLGGCLDAPAEAPVVGEAELAACESVAFADDFDQPGWRDARWAGSDTSAGGDLFDAGGRAVITSDGDPDSYGWYATTETFDFEGRCLHVDVPRVFVHGDVVATEAYLGVYLGDDWIAIGQHRGQLCCDHERGVASMGEQCAVTYSPEAHARWRLRFVDDAVACDVAPASGDWTEYARLPYAGPLTGSIELLAGTWDEVEEIPVQVEFDNLNM